LHSLQPIKGSVVELSCDSTFHGRLRATQGTDPMRCLTNFLAAVVMTFLLPGFAFSQTFSGTGGPIPPTGTSGTSTF